MTWTKNRQPGEYPLVSQPKFEMRGDPDRQRPQDLNSFGLRPWLPALLGHRPPRPRRAIADSLPKVALTGVDVSQPYTGIKEVATPGDDDFQLTSPFLPPLEIAKCTLFSESDTSNALVRLVRQGFLQEGTQTDEVGHPDGRATPLSWRSGPQFTAGLDEEGYPVTLQPGAQLARSEEIDSARRYPDIVRGSYEERTSLNKRLNNILRYSEDFSDPGPWTDFTHLGSTIVLTRSLDHIGESTVRPEERRGEPET